MARMNRRGQYYNYPNLRTNVNHTSQRMDQKVHSGQEVHAMNEIRGEKADTTYNMPDRSTYEGEREENRQNVSENRQEMQAGTKEEKCRVRFFNAAAGYGELEIMVGNQKISNNLGFGSVTNYVEIPGGFVQMKITMIQEPKAVLLDKKLPFRNCMNTTAAIINTSTGIEIMMIHDTGCRLNQQEYACFRVVNLSYTSPPIDVILENGNPVFEDVRFKYVTEYKQVVPGEYNFNVMLARTAEVLKNNTVDVITPERPVEEGGYPGEDESAYAYFFEDFENGKSYTAYMIGNKGYEPPLRVETLEENE